MTDRHKLEYLLRPVRGHMYISYFICMPAMHRRQCVRSISRMSCSVRCFCRLISSPDILISGIIVAELNWTELLVILTVWNKSKHWYKGTRAHCGYEKSRKTLSCHCADWVHKAGMLIVACSGLRSSIIQQTGLFSIQSVLLLVVMVVVVEVEWEDWGEGNNYSTPHRAHTHTHIRPAPPNPHIRGCLLMNNTSKALQG